MKVRLMIIIGVISFLLGGCNKIQKNSNQVQLVQRTEEILVESEDLADDYFHIYKERWNQSNRNSLKLQQDIIEYLGRKNYIAALAYLGFLIIYTYIDIGVFILGFFMGKIIVKRSIDISFLRCLIYALISFGLMLLIGSLKYVFYDYMYSNFTFTFSIFIESLGDRDSLFVSIGTFISFLISLSEISIGEQKIYILTDEYA